LTKGLKLTRSLLRRTVSRPPRAMLTGVDGGGLVGDGVTFTGGRVAIGPEMNAMGVGVVDAWLSQAISRRSRTMNVELWRRRGWVLPLIC
jgi:hypothetical protein